jgi:hypothetical protein
MLVATAAKLEVLLFTPERASMKTWLMKRAKKGAADINYRTVRLNIIAMISGQLVLAPVDMHFRLHVLTGAPVVSEVGYPLSFSYSRNRMK